MLITPELCTGCRLCQLACSFNNCSEFNLFDAKIVVLNLETEGVSVPVVCWQCEGQFCHRACPNESIYITQEQVVRIKDDCIGCLMCVDACPYGAIRSDSEGNRPLKCEVCSSDPPCASICPTGAIRYVEDNLANRLQLRIVGEQIQNVLPKRGK